MKVTKSKVFNFAAIKPLLGRKLAEQFQLKTAPRFFLCAYQVDKVNDKTGIAELSFKKDGMNIDVELTVADAISAVRASLKGKKIKEIAIETQDTSKREGHYHEISETFKGLRVTFK